LTFKINKKNLFKRNKLIMTKKKIKIEDISFDEDDIIEAVKEN